MDIATGLGLAAGAIVVATMMLLGGSLEMFVSEHAVIIIFGGSFAATLIRFPLTAIFHGLPLGARIRLYHAAHEPARARGRDRGPR